MSVINHTRKVATKRSLLSLGLLLGMGVAAGQADAQPYELFYDQSTGELSMTLYGNIISYSLESSDPIFLEDEALTPTNHQRFVGFFYVNGNPIAVPVGTAASTPTGLTETNSSYNGPPSGTFSLGFVLPAGLTQTQLAAVFDVQATYVVAQGTPKQNFNIIGPLTASPNIVISTTVNSTQTLQFGDNILVNSLGHLDVAGVGIAVPSGVTAEQIEISSNGMITTTGNSIDIQSATVLYDGIYNEGSIVSQASAIFVSNNSNIGSFNNHGLIQGGAYAIHIDASSTAYYGIYNTTTGLIVGGISISGDDLNGEGIDFTNVGLLDLADQHDNLLSGIFTQSATGALAITLDSASFADGLLFTVNEDAALAGELLLTLDGELVVNPGDSLVLMQIGGTRTGEFGNYNEGDLIDEINGVELRLTYTAGDGNDVAVYAVPEPASLLLMGLAGLACTSRRRAA